MESTKNGKLSPMPKVKICGNTNTKDAKLAIDQGADYLGFIFAGSKRQVAANQAKDIMQSLPDFSNFVAVFHNQAKDEVEDILKITGIKIIQFHGDETSRYCSSFEERDFEVIKTFHIKDEMSLKRIDEYNVHAFLFDTYKAGQAGGTGETFDWDLIRDKPFITEKLFLAGGLNPDNLEEALKIVKPYAVDVASGVESAPGQKDPKKLKSFISIAKAFGKENVTK